MSNRVLTFLLKIYVQCYSYRLQPRKATLLLAIAFNFIPNCISLLVFNLQYQSIWLSFVPNIHTRLLLPLLRHSQSITITYPGNVVL